MRIININETEVIVNEKTVLKMVEHITMESKQEILIRNKQDTYKLSKKTQEISDEIRKQRYQQAVKENDILYLNSIYKNISIIDLLKMLYIKTKNHI